MAAFLEQLSPVPGQSFRLLSWEGGLTDMQLHVAPGQSHPVTGSAQEWHRHPEIELMLITQGQGNCMAGDCLIQVNQGEVFMIGRNLPHHWRFEDDSAGFCLQFDPSQPHSVWQSPEFESLKPLWRQSERGLRLAGTLAQALLQDAEQLLTLTPMARLNQLTAMLDRIAASSDQAISQLASSAFHLLEPGDAHDDSIAKVMHLIFTRFQESLRLEDILKSLPLSRATFSRHFKVRTGRTFSCFLREVRLSYVCHLLETTNRNVTDIAFDSGFNDLPYFHRTFRQHTKLSPTEWRHQHTTQIRDLHASPSPAELLTSPR